MRWKASHATRQRPSRVAANGIITSRRNQSGTCLETAAIRSITPVFSSEFIPRGQNSDNQAFDRNNPELYRRVNRELPLDRENNLAGVARNERINSYDA